MGYLGPILVAYVQTSIGSYIFHDSCKGGQEQLASSLIFLFSIFLVIWKMKLIPRANNIPFRAASYLIQYLFSQFTMEHIMNNFWYPLDSSVNTFFPKVADYESHLWRNAGFDYGILFFLKWKIVASLFSYVIAVMCLSAALRYGAGACIEEYVEGLKNGFKQFFSNRTNGEYDEYSSSGDGHHGRHRNYSPKRYSEYRSR